MRIEDLKIFVDLAETLNFRQTAQNRHLTQPGVSQLIKSMENELGVSLFERNRRNVKLTEGGLSFYEDMKRLIKKYDAAFERAREIAEHHNQSFTIGFTGTLFENYLMPRIISSFNHKCPEVQIYLMNFNHNLLKKDLVSREFDAIFQTLDSVEELSEVHYTNLLKGKFVCVLPLTHPLSQQEKISFTDLKQEKIILFNAHQSPPKQTEVQKILKEKCSQASFIYADSVALGHTMIQGGLGLAVMPDFVTNFSQLKEERQLTVVPLDYDVMLDYGIVSLNNAKRDLIQTFIASTKKQIADLRK